MRIAFGILLSVYVNHLITIKYVLSFYTHAAHFRCCNYLFQKPQNMDKSEASHQSCQK